MGTLLNACTHRDTPITGGLICRCTIFDDGGKSANFHAKPVKPRTAMRKSTTRARQTHVKVCTLCTCVSAATVCQVKLRKEDGSFKLTLRPGPGLEGINQGALPCARTECLGSSLEHGPRSLETARGGGRRGGKARQVDAALVVLRMMTG